MKGFYITGYALAGIAIFTFGYMAAPRVAHAQTQAQMDEQAGDEFQKADLELNRVYRQTLKKLQDDGYDPATRKKLIASERAWVTYRDAESEYEASAMAEGGSMYPQVADMAATRLTEERIKLLKNSLYDH